MRRITVVLGDEEYELLRESAFARRLSMAEFVRRAVGSAAVSSAASPVVVRVPPDVLGGPVAPVSIGEITNAVEELKEKDRAGKCPMNVPRGAKCKACGKTH